MRNFILSFLALILLPAYMSGQEIKGTVLDENNMPLPGVSISNVKSGSSTVSDFDGNFSVSAETGDALKFSFIGYKDLTINVAANMKVSMQVSRTDLSEVVVVGYGTQKKADITGNVAVVNEKELRNKPNANVVSSIQGKVAGVVINNGGKPGSSPGISIRGIGSISGSDILYVVDGVLTNNIDYLNPNDVASMSILKDASSSAIYGIRAANGVIVITTKMGKKTGAENIKFTYDANVGFSKPTNLLEMANSDDYIRLYNEKLDYEGNTSAGARLNATDLRSTNTDWYDEILRKSSFTQTQNIGITGASEKTQYSLGLGYFTQEGILNANKGISAGDDYKRVSARFNGLYNVTDKFRVGGGFAYSRGNSNDPANPFYDARSATPVTPVYNPDGSYGYWDPTDAVNNPTGINLGEAGKKNPRMTLDNFRGKTKESRTIVNGYAEYDLFKDLTFKMSYSSDQRSKGRYEYSAEQTPLGSVTVNPSKLISETINFESILWENTLTWSKTFNKHRLVVLAGFSRQQDQERSLKGQALNVPFNGDDSTLFLNLGDNQTVVGYDKGLEGYKTRLQSYFGRIQYAFADKYLLNATVRRDGTSAYNFSGNQKSATFPSVGLGWVISKENFMQNAGIDFLKLKGSWGQLGNASIPRQYDRTTTNLPAAFFGNSGQQLSAISFTQQVDPSIDWEVVEELDFGLELRTLKNRLSVEAGYYDRKTTDAVFAIAIPSQAGLGNDYVTNAGDFKNKGLEFVLSWDDKIGEKFTYGIYGNLTTIDNEITKVFGGSFLNTGGGYAGDQTKRWEVGQEVGAFYGFQVTGVTQTAEATPANPAGSLKFADLNGDGIINNNDKTFLGSPIPELTYGFGVNLGYSNIDFNIDMQGVAGNEIYNMNRTTRFGNENWDQDFVDNHWTPSNPSNSYMAASTDQTHSRVSSFFVEKGDYFRIRQITLGYTLPKTFMDNIKIERLRFYLSAQNPFTSFNYNGFSPELGKQTIQDAGNDYNVYPLSAVYSFGINLNF